MAAVGGYANMPSGHFESARWHHFRTEHVSTLVCQHAPASPPLVSISARLLRRLVSTLQPPAFACQHAASLQSVACQHFSLSYLSYGLRMITPPYTTRERTQALPLPSASVIPATTTPPLPSYPAKAGILCGRRYAPPTTSNLPDYVSAGEA